jgi:hypothetical protein
MIIRQIKSPEFDSDMGQRQRRDNQSDFSKSNPDNINFKPHTPYIIGQNTTNIKQRECATRQKFIKTSLKLLKDENRQGSKYELSHESINNKTKDNCMNE